MSKYESVANWMKLDKLRKTKCTQPQGLYSKPPLYLSLIALHVHAKWIT